MAINPWQGGVPQVTDSGASGRGIVDPVRPAIDYEKTFRAAVQPLNVLTDSLGKFAEVQLARTIKAESDDAERQVVELVNRVQYDPETGYLNKKGRNAMDAYAQAQKDINDGIEKIQSGLRPIVRENSKGRIADRQQQALNTMGRWNVAQTSAYHIQSAQATIETTLKDAANHYGDKNYLATCWERIKEQLDFIAETSGLPEEARKQLFDQHWTQLQSGRFQAWAEDDPVNALARFKTEAADIDPDTRRKLDGYLWNRAKPLLALQVARQYGQSMLERQDFVRSMIGKKTGIAAVDSLSKEQQRELWSAAYSKKRIDNTKEKIELGRRLANAYEEVSREGTVSDPLEEKDFTGVYGKEQGKEEFEKYRRQLGQNMAFFDLQGMSKEQIKGEIDRRYEAIKPGDPDYAEKMKFADAFAQGAVKLTAERKARPLETAERNGLIPSLNPGGTDNPARLKARMDARKEIAVMYGFEPEDVGIMTAEEFAAECQAFEGKPLHERLQYAEMLYAAIGDRGASLLAGMAGGKPNLFVQSVGLADTVCPDGTKLIQKLNLGQAALDNKQVEVTKEDEQEFANLIASDGKDLGLYPDPDVEKNLINASKPLIALRKLQGGKVGDAVQDAVGNTLVWAGRKAYAPKGIDKDNLKSALEYRLGKAIPDSAVFQANGLPVTGRELKEELLANRKDGVQLVSEGRRPDGSVDYRILYSTAGSYVGLPDGKDLVINIRPGDDKGKERETEEGRRKRIKEIAEKSHVSERWIETWSDEQLESLEKSLEIIDKAGQVSTKKFSQSIKQAWNESGIKQAWNEPNRDLEAEKETMRREVEEMAASYGVSRSTVDEMDEAGIALMHEVFRNIGRKREEEDEAFPYPGVRGTISPTSPLREVTEQARREARIEGREPASTTRPGWEASQMPELAGRNREAISAIGSALMSRITENKPLLLEVAKNIIEKEPNGSSVRMLGALTEEQSEELRKAVHEVIQAEKEVAEKGSRRVKEEAWSRLHDTFVKIFGNTDPGVANWHKWSKQFYSPLGDSYYWQEAVDQVTGARPEAVSDPGDISLPDGLSGAFSSTVKGLKPKSRVRVWVQNGITNIGGPGVTPTLVPDPYIEQQKRQLALLLGALAEIAREPGEQD